jgi:hypothetical protein
VTLGIALGRCAVRKKRDCGPNTGIGVESKPRRRNRLTLLRYSAAMGDDTLGDAETFAEPFAALVSSSGLSEWRDFPSK